ncbi:MAG: undecaprenyldiphospho-muramoylpentapeptide beta-N-acetylglucosaminyltransferase [Alphaproteobacteria bacterium]|nr:undecaprenyldiphospho-muramoylpentapeptide beta-N-acetylglucosaminyltransferase [Alphaproteobacteria bacterium]
MSIINSQRPIFLVAGGTGGHIFPALALSDILLSTGYIPHLITDPRGSKIQKNNSRLVIHQMLLSGMGQGNLIQKSIGFLSLGIGLFQSLWWILRFQPQVVIGFGGYPTLPGMVAAIVLRRLTVIHEQNAVLGRVNRFLAPWVRKIAVSFPSTLGLLQKQAARVEPTGMPVRDTIAEVRKIRYQPLKLQGKLNVLVLGGSQGTRIFSEIIPEALSLLSPQLRQKVHMVQQCRSEDLDNVKRSYLRMGVSCELASFFDNIAEHLASSHLVISRSGASTCAELMVAGRPALLVPLPSAMDDHQTVNARWIAQKDAAWYIPQKEFTASNLATIFQDFFSNPTTLVHASEAMRSLGQRDAARQLVELIKRFIETSNKGEL